MQSSVTEQWRSHWGGKGGRVPPLTVKNLPKIRENWEKIRKEEEKSGGGKKNREEKAKIGKFLSLCPSWKKGLATLLSQSWLKYLLETCNSLILKLEYSMGISLIFALHVLFVNYNEEGAGQAPQKEPSCTHLPPPTHIHPHTPPHTHTHTIMRRLKIRQTQLEFWGSQPTRLLYSQNIQHGPPLGNVKKCSGGLPYFASPLPWWKNVLPKVRNQH